MNDSSYLNLNSVLVSYGFEILNHWFKLLTLSLKQRGSTKILARSCHDTRWHDIQTRQQNTETGYIVLLHQQIDSVVGLIWHFFMLCISRLFIRVRTWWQHSIHHLWGLTYILAFETALPNDMLEPQRWIVLAGITKVNTPNKIFIMFVQVKPSLAIRDLIPHKLLLIVPSINI